MKNFHIDPDNWEQAAQDRPTWRSLIHKGGTVFENNRIANAEKKRELRKQSQNSDIPLEDSNFACPTCGKQFRAQIGLFSHIRTHRRTFWCYGHHPLGWTSYIYIYILQCWMTYTNVSPILKDCAYVLLQYMTLSISFNSSVQHAIICKEAHSGKDSFLEVVYEWEEKYWPKYCILNVNVNIYIYSLISHRFQQTSKFTPLVFELLHIWSHLAHFLQLMPFTILHFSFHQVPITAGWTEAAWYERLAQHPYTWPAAWPEHQSPIQALTRLGVA